MVWSFSILKVFGTKKALWLLPVFSKEDLDKIPALQGLEFPTRSDVEAWGFVSLQFFFFKLLFYLILGSVAFLVFTTWRL